MTGVNLWFHPSYHQAHFQPSSVIKAAVRLWMSSANISYFSAWCFLRDSFSSWVRVSFVLWYECQLITCCQSHLSIHTPVHRRCIVYIKELMELHEDGGKPTLHLNQIGKPFSTLRLFIMSCMPFTLQSARKEHFLPEKRCLSWKRRNKMRKTKGDFVCQGFWQCNLIVTLMALKRDINVNVIIFCDLKGFTFIFSIVFLFQMSVWNLYCLINFCFLCL